MSFLESFIKENSTKIEEWIGDKKSGSELFFYSSCDVRYAGFKITQVDANCFPAGFNNLNKEGYQKAVSIYSNFFKEKGVKNVLIFPEFHTRNFGYLKNVKTLKSIFEEAGVNVRAATNLDYKLNIDLSESEIKSILDELDMKEQNISLDPIKKYKWFFQKKYKITTMDCEKKKGCFVADLIILNNDLSGGMLDILKDTIPNILPSPKMGWHNRTKSNHFFHYKNIVEEFATDFKIDPWFFDSYFDTVDGVNFKDGIGLDKIEEKLNILLEKISKKYLEYNINAKPTIFIKSNKGTYGMGIHTVSSAEEVRNFNKNIRKKLNMVKDGVVNESVILQEGVPTMLQTIEGRAVEPVVYSALSSPISMFFRINDGFISNLNSNGMVFSSDFNLSEDAQKLINLTANFANLAILSEVKSL